jgi:hypothetical protein
MRPFIIVACCRRKFDVVRKPEGSSPHIGNKGRLSQFQFSVNWLTLHEAVHCLTPVPAPVMIERVL